MNDLKKIATELRGDASPDPNDEREVSSAWLRERMRQHADALDALAAQTGEPVGWRLIRKRDGFVRGFQRTQPDAESLEFARVDGDEYQPCYLAPPPSPVSMAELEKALDEYARSILAESDENDGNAIGYADAIVTRRTRAEVLRLASQGVRPRVPEWQPIETAPKDGTSVLLLIDGAVHALHDDEHAVSIGSYGVNGGPEEDPTWCFAGWSWSHDEYVRGGGTPIGWMPLPALGIEVQP